MNDRCNETAMIYLGQVPEEHDKHAGGVRNPLLLFTWPIVSVCRLSIVNLTSRGSEAALVWRERTKTKSSRVPARNASGRVMERAEGADTAMVEAGSVGWE